MNRKEYGILLVIALAAVIMGVVATDNDPITAFTTNAADAAHLVLVMAWETWWALVLGFMIAGAVEAWVSKEEITGLLEGHGPREIVLGTFFGFVSSSCSYSAVATSKNIFKKGASAAASLAAFMFASTNLVIEIGFVIWILLGWQFVVADFVGGLILILLMALAFIYIVPDEIIEEARNNAGSETEVARDPVCGMDVNKEETEYTITDGGSTYYFCSKACMESFDPAEHQTSIRESATSLGGWKELADKQWKEWGMLWEDIVVGFVLAGIIGAYVPNTFWASLFTSDAFGLPVLVLYTSVLGALIGVATFVCSVGNVPFAAILWNNGLPFGSVLSFIYADLIVPPIMDAYRKYYGTRFAAVLSLTIFIAAVITGFAIHFIFLNAGLIPTEPATIVDRSIELNYKAALNIGFTLLFIALYILHTTEIESRVTHGHTP